MRAMVRAMLAALAIFAAGAFASAQASGLSLRRGVNFEAWQVWTSRGGFMAPGYDRAHFPDWTARVSDADLRALRAAGFDFVRLNVDVSPLFWVEGMAEAGALLDAAGAATARLQRAGFSVVFDMHLMPEQDDRPGGIHDVLGTGGREAKLFSSYLVLVSEAARRLAALPADKTALELVNEPDQDWFSYAPASDRWPGQLSALYKAARAAAPKLPLVLTGARSGLIEGLLRLDAKPYAGDPNIFWSFHYYEPMAITHAGQPWEETPARFLTHLPYPARKLDEARAHERLAAARAELDAVIADPARRRELWGKIEAALAAYRDSNAGPETIAADFAQVKGWAKANDVPARRILLGEFGVFQDQADRAARLAVLKATREAAEADGFGWAVYTAGLTQPGRSFSITASGPTLRVEPGAAAALGLTGR